MRAVSAIWRHIIKNARGVVSDQSKVDEGNLKRYSHTLF